MGFRIKALIKGRYVRAVALQRNKPKTKRRYSGLNSAIALTKRGGTFPEIRGL